MGDAWTGSPGPPGRAESGGQPATAPGSPPTLQALIRWLALPYADGEPIFQRQGQITTEFEFEASEMQQLYREVVGTSGDPVQGVWKQCPCCLKWSVDNTAVIAYPDS